jgi:hypothetical protein
MCGINTSRFETVKLSVHIVCSFCLVGKGRMKVFIVRDSTLRVGKL